MRLDGAPLVNARLQRGLTQQDVAKLLEVSIPSVCRAENSARIRPSFGRRLVEFYGLDLSKLVIPVGAKKRKKIA